MLRLCAAIAVSACILTAAPARAAGAIEQDAPIKMAQAEETPFLLRLFGLRKNQEQRAPGGAKVIRVPRNSATPPQVRDQPPSGSATGPKRISVPKSDVVIAPKDYDARRVLVIGDRLADDLARGLEVAFADTPKVRIDSLSVEGSGAVSDSPVNWAAKIGENLSGTAPADAIVVMFGVDDRAPISQGGRELAFRTEAWEQAYRQRVRELLLAARSRNVPVFLVGLVPMADIALTTDIAYIDDLFRQEAQSAFTTYIDIWNEFADDTGSYAASGPDVGGQSRQLRLNDGIGFTRSGSRKLAFYVEQEIRSWVDRGSPGLVLPQASGDGLVMSLTDPEVGLDEDLAGAGVSPLPKDGTPLYDLVVLGKPLVPVVGRIDDLSVR